MDREKLRLLETLVHNIVIEEAGGDEHLISLVLDRRKKTSCVIRARERVLRRIRSEIWECYKGGEWNIKKSKQHPGDKWHSLGYNRARIIVTDGFSVEDSW